MRKRIVTGVLVIVGVGVLVFVVSQPKKETVEWHKKEYLDAWRRSNQQTLASARKRARGEFLLIMIQNTNTLHVIALKEDMPLFVEAVRKADEP